MRRYNDRSRDYVYEMQEDVREYQPRESRDRQGGRIARVRVELKKKFNDPIRNFKEMLHEFRRRVSHAGILHEYKGKQYYESRGEKDRKTRRDSAKKLLMDELKKRILAGERVEGHGGMVKKILSNLKKERLKEEKRKERRKQYQQNDKE